MTLKTSTGLLFPHWRSTGNDKGIVKHKIQWCQWSSQLESVFNWKQFWIPISKGGSTFHETGKFGAVACRGGQKWIEMEDRKQGSSLVICFARLFSATWCNDNQSYAIRTLMFCKHMLTGNTGILGKSLHQHLDLSTHDLHLSCNIYLQIM